MANYKATHRRRKRKAISEKRAAARFGGLQIGNNSEPDNPTVPLPYVRLDALLNK